MYLGRGTQAGVTHLGESARKRRHTRTLRHRANVHADDAVDTERGQGTPDHTTRKSQMGANRRFGVHTVRRRVVANPGKVVVHKDVHALRMSKHNTSRERRWDHTLNASFRLRARLVISLQLVHLVLKGFLPEGAAQEFDYFQHFCYPFSVPCQPATGEGGMGQQKDGRPVSQYLSANRRPIS